MPGNKNSGNRNCTGKKAKHGQELVQRTRAVVIGAFDYVEREAGMKLSEVFGRALLDDPVRFLQAASKVFPKELYAEIHEHVRHTVINAQPDISVEEWQNQHQRLSGNPSPDPKAH